MEDRCEARPGLAAVVRVVTFLVPIAASTVFAMFASALLPPASSRLVQLVTFGVIAVASTGVLMLVDRAARRLLPLAALPNLSIVFPDQAPSRYRVARSAAGVRSLEARLEHARRLGVEDEPTRAAALILELVTALQHHDGARGGTRNGSTCSPRCSPASSSSRGAVDHGAQIDLRDDGRWIELTLVIGARGEAASDGGIVPHSDDFDSAAVTTLRVRVDAAAPLTAPIHLDHCTVTVD